MSVAKHIELTAESSEGFDAAIRDGLAKAGETVKGIRSAWVKDQQVLFADGAVTAYRVTMKVTFVLAD